jgi:hypothetical protein
MAIQDTIPLTTLERMVSTDFTRFEDLVNRSMAELAASLIRTLEADLGLNPTTTVVREHVASGLQIYTDGATVWARTGFLIQNVTPSPPDVPTPGAFDSPYRFGLLMADEDVTDPWDGTTAFWLLQARVERITTLTEFRDIWNPATETFAPSGAPLDKRYESQVVFDWKKGTAANIPTPDAGYAPIGWCYRPAAGTPINEFDVASMSIQLEDLAPRSFDIGSAIRKNFRFRSSNGIGRTSSFAECDLEADVFGLRCRFLAANGGSFSPLDSEFVPTADAAALAVNNTIGYVYVAPLPDAMPSKSPNGTSGVRQRGVLVVSRTPPDERGLNSLAITPPAPFANYTIPINGAAHVGIVRVSAVAGQIEFVSVSSKGHGRVDARQFNNGSFPLNQGNSYVGPAGPSYFLNILGPGGTEDVPYGVQLECFLEHTRIDDTAVAISVEMTFGMGTAGAADDTSQPTLWPQMALATDAWSVREFMLYPQPGNLTMTVDFRPLDANGALIAGGAPANGGNNDFAAGWHGFQF